MYCTFLSRSHKLSSLHDHRSAIILAVSICNSNQAIFLQPPFPKTLKADDKIFIVCLQWSHLGQMLSYFTRWSVQKDNFAFNMQPLPIYIFCQIMLLFWGGAVRYKLAQNGCGINRYLGSLIPAQTCFVFLLWKILITFL